jgi:8-oxo-dGTP pyrophosphatase MutT (NUDIX family)
METSCGFIVYFKPENKIVLGAPPNSTVWSIPKGRKDESENNIQAALRELYEESNIPRNFIDSSDVYHLTPRKYKGRNKELVPFLCVTEVEPINLKCNSFFTQDGVEYPEFSIIRLIAVDDILSGKITVHHTQLEAIKEAMKLAQTL